MMLVPLLSRTEGAHSMLVPLFSLHGRAGDTLVPLFSRSMSGYGMMVPPAMRGYGMMVPPTVRGYGMMVPPAVRGCGMMVPPFFIAARGMGRLVRLVARPQGSGRAGDRLVPPLGHVGGRRAALGRLADLRWQPIGTAEFPRSGVALTVGDTLPIVGAIDPQRESLEP